MRARNILQARSHTRTCACVLGHHHSHAAPPCHSTHAPSCSCACAPAQTLLLLEKFHAYCDASVGRLRPSCMALSRSGRVTFPASPLCAHAPHAGASIEGGASGRAHRRAQLHGAQAGPLAGGSAQPQGWQGVGGAGEDGEPSAAVAASRGGRGSRGSSPPAVGRDAQGPCRVQGSSSRGGGAACSLDPVDLLYASPEEERGCPATRQSDVFSLGVLFFELFHVVRGGGAGAPGVERGCGAGRCSGALGQCVSHCLWCKGSSLLPPAC